MIVDIVPESDEESLDLMESYSFDQAEEMVQDSEDSLSDDLLGTINSKLNESVYSSSPDLLSNRKILKNYPQFAETTRKETQLDEKSESDSTTDNLGNESMDEIIDNSDTDMDTEEENMTIGDKELYGHIESLDSQKTVIMDKIENENWKHQNMLHTSNEEEAGKDLDYMQHFKKMERDEIKIKDIEADNEEKSSQDTVISDTAKEENTTEKSTTLSKTYTSTNKVPRSENMDTQPMKKKNDYENSASMQTINRVVAKELEPNHNNIPIDGYIEDEVEANALHTPYLLSKNTSLECSASEEVEKNTSTETIVCSTSKSRKKREYPSTQSFPSQRRQRNAVRKNDPLVSVEEKEEKVIEKKVIEDDKKKMYSKSLDIRIAVTAIEITRHMKQQIRNIGATFVNDAEKATHLIAPPGCFKRTVKILCAISCCRYILSSTWLNDSIKHGKALNEDEYILQDHQAESLWNFNLAHLLSQENRHMLFDGLYFYIPSPHHNLLPPKQDLVKIIQCASGKIINKLPKSSEHKQLIILSCLETIKCIKGKSLKDLFKKIIHSTEWILSSLLQQRLDFNSHQISIS